MKRAFGLHPDAQDDQAMRVFTAERGLLGALHRATQIAALPRVTWKGRTLYTLRCQGQTGRGPHDQHVPAALLWSLIRLDWFRCPYHAHGFRE